MTIVILSTTELLFLCTGSYPARPGGVELCPLQQQRMGAAGAGIFMIWPLSGRNSGAAYSDKGEETMNTRLIIIILAAVVVVVAAVYIFGGEEAQPPETPAVTTSPDTSTPAPATTPDAGTPGQAN